MDDSVKAIRQIRAQIDRFVNLYNKLENIPFDVGEGDLLYPSEMHALEALGSGTGKTVTELCEAFGVTKGAVSQTIGKLASKGYVKKERIKGYPREVILSLTLKGKDVFEKHERFHAKMDKELVDSISSYPAEAINNFQQIITRAENHIKKYIMLKNKKL